VSIKSEHKKVRLKSEHKKVSIKSEHKVNEHNDVESLWWRASFSEAAHDIPLPASSRPLC
jgi:hypothetical protein